VRFAANFLYTLSFLSKRPGFSPCYFMQFHVFQSVTKWSEESFPAIQE